jgi:hypothetical protein
MPMKREKERFGGEKRQVAGSKWPNRGVFREYSPG